MVLDVQRQGDQRERSTGSDVCPYLGLRDDPRSRFSVADPAHWCHVRSKRVRVDLGHQGAFCLTANHPACPRYRAPATAGHPARRLATNRTRRRVAAVIAVVVLVSLLVVLGVAASNGAIGGFLGAR
jgi:hypothetical protein